MYNFVNQLDTPENIVAHQIIVSDKTRQKATHEKENQLLPGYG
jgi:hypothetical protein